MNAFMNAALLAVGLAVTGAGVVAAEDALSFGTDPNALIEHHSTAHNIGTCGILPCPPKPKPNQGR